MEPKEFFEEVEKSLRLTSGSDPVGVFYFIQDVEELIDKWHEDYAKE